MAFTFGSGLGFLHAAVLVVVLLGEVEGGQFVEVVEVFSLLLGAYMSRSLRMASMRARAAESSFSRNAECPPHYF